MVHSCSAVNCTQRFVKGTTFHQFPLDVPLLKQWVEAIGRKDWVPSKSSKICSRHFTEDSYETSGWSSRRKLKSTAVPTIFSLSEYFQKNEAPTPYPLETIPSTNNNLLSCCAQTNSKCDKNEDQMLILKKRRECYIGDFDVRSINEKTPLSHIMKYVHTSKSVISRKNKQIRVLMQKNRRLQKKLTDLEAHINHIKVMEPSAETILDSLTSPSRELFTQMLNGNGDTYPKELKCFALTLDFYSPKAYDYVRRTFNNCLPHRRTIQKWYENIECEPEINLQEVETA